MLNVAPNADETMVADHSFSINIIPDEKDFAAALNALESGDEACISSTYFQHYVALIATCVARGHRSMTEIVANVAPLVGAKNAVHVPWLVEILAGPACDVHLWEWDGHEHERYLYGPVLQLKDELLSAAAPQA